MFRHIIAATAVSLFATGAIAQNTINEAGTGGNSTVDANTPTVNRLAPQDTGTSAAVPTASGSLAPQPADPTRTDPASAARAANESLAPQPADASRVDPAAAASANDSLAPQEPGQVQTGVRASDSQRMTSDEAALVGTDRAAGEDDTGVIREGTYSGSTTDANSPTVDRVQPSTN